MVKPPRVPSSRPRAAPTGKSVRLNVARIGIWSVTAMTFLVSVGVGLLGILGVTLMWRVLNQVGAFATVNSALAQATGLAVSINVLDYVGQRQVLSMSVVAAAAGVIVLTVFAAVAAVLYNIVAALVGGLRPLLAEAEE